MCISVEPGEFSNTYIADFPATPTSDTDRVVSYMNMVETRVPAYLARALGRSAAAQTLPNAMLFAVYGENVRVLPADDPQASRDWLLNLQSAYAERWEAQEDWQGATRSLDGFDFDDEPRITRSGNYNVGIAQNVTDIPRILAALKAASPGEVPDVSPATIEQMQRYYDMQKLGIPRFVVAAFAVEEGSTEDMHPITVRYDQMVSTRGMVVLPALDYHGQGQWQPYVPRDHHLFVATNRLIQLLAPTEPANQGMGETPSELAGAPAEFPIMIVDQRDSRPDSDQATWAPNNDYVFDTTAIGAALAPAATELAALNEAKMNEYDRRDITEIVRRQLGYNGVMARSNQEATTVAAYNEALLNNF